MEEKKNAKKIKKYSKNVAKIKKSATKRNFRRDEKNETIMKKCNKQIVKNQKNDTEILNTINEFNTNGKKTIAYFIDSYYPVIDGVVAVLDNYAKYMSKFFNVVVCTPKHKKASYKTENYFVLSSDSVHLKKQGYDLGYPQFDAEFSKYMSMLRIDIVHINAPFTMGMFGIELAKKRHIPSVVTFHSQFKQDFYKSTKSKMLASILTDIIIKFYEKPTLVLTMNEFSKNIMKEYGLKRNNVQLLPNATSLKFKEFDKNKEREVLENYKITAGKFTMLFIGRFVKVKNIFLIIDVLEELYKTNKDFQFIFMGYGPEEERMKKLIKEKGIENNIVFTGKILDEDEKSIIIKSSNLLFFPSEYDTDGIVKIECACFGVPTLCLEGTGVASGIENNDTGFVEKNDIKILASKLDELSKNVDFVQKIGKNAKERLYITWDDVGEKLKNIYEKLLSAKNLKGLKKKNKIFNINKFLINLKLV